MSRITTTVVTLLLAATAFGQAKEDAGDGKKLDKQTMEWKDYLPEIHGTIRGKYEFQTETEESRFEVRNARFSVSGNVHPIVAYKAEIDLSDEGSIKMLDAYARVFPVKDLNFTIGQMRVPFTIDAHRSPHQQYFANRSDKVGGSTLGNLAMAQVSMNCVDIGLPQLAMHSSWETMGAQDCAYLAAAAARIFETEL